MSHRYGCPIRVSLRANRPISFEWRGARYLVAEVLSTWHLRDRWWEPMPTTSLGTAVAPSAVPSDRQYYRVRCADEQIFDLYYDMAGNSWVMDYAHD